MTRYRQACVPALVRLAICSLPCPLHACLSKIPLPCQTYFFTGVGDMDAYEPDCLFAGGHVIAIVIWLRHNLTATSLSPCSVCRSIHRLQWVRLALPPKGMLPPKPASLDLNLQGGALQEECLKPGRPSVRMLCRACCGCCHFA